MNQLPLVDGDSQVGAASASLPVPSAFQRLFHDLNNALAAAHSTLDLMSLVPNLPAEAESLLREAQEQLERAARLARPNAPDTLVMSDARQTRSNPVSGPGVAPASTVDGHERILVVDDEKGVLLMLRALLCYRGYRITTAANGTEAMAAVTTAGAFDLVILDLYLADEDGPEVFRQLKTLQPNLRVLFVSGSLTTPEQEHLRSVGRFLTKPFQNEELLRVVRGILDEALDEPVSRSPP